MERNTTSAPEDQAWEVRQLQFLSAIDQGNLDVVVAFVEMGADPAADKMSGQYSLEMAVAKGDYEMTKFLLQLGVKTVIGQEIAEKLTAGAPLTLTATASPKNIARLLLEYEAAYQDPTGRQYESAVKPLFIALHTGHFEVARLLLQHGADPNQLMEAEPFLLLFQFWHKLTFAQLLCEHVAKPDQMNVLRPVIVALQRGQPLSHPETIQWNGLTRMGYFSLLSLMILGGNIAGALFLLENGASAEVESGRILPLHASLRVDNIEIARELVRRGASVDMKDEQGLSPLHKACKTSSVDFARLLVKAGAKLEGTDSLGITPLFYACFHGNEAVVCLLLAAGGSPNISAMRTETTSDSTKRTFMGFERYSLYHWSPLGIAAHRGFARTVQILLNFGADKSHKTKDGQTALDLAMAGFHFDVALALLKANSPFAMKRLRASRFLVQAIERCSSELVNLLTVHGVQSTTFERRSLIVHSSTSNVNLLYPSTLLSLRTVQGQGIVPLLGVAGLAKKSRFCSSCMQFLHRNPTLCTLPFPITYKVHPECRLCHLVFESIPGHGGSSAPKLNIQLFLGQSEEGRPPYLEVFAGIKTVKHNLVQVPGSWNSVLEISSRLENKHTGFPAAMVIATHWLENCLSSHRQCNPYFANSYFPTRILDVLVSEDMKDPVLREGLVTTDPYLALSHRWGTVGLPITTLANVNARKKGTPMETLSKTMQDAITITRNLGFRYLWVDALCIIQDSEEDWQREASTMRNVYRRAALTLAVAAAEDHSSGIFTSRESHSIHPMLLEDLVMPQTVRSYFDGDGYMYILPSIPKLSHGIRPKGPLDERKWILQEQLLSPHILYYGQGELFWDCITVSASESSPISAPPPVDGELAEIWALKLIRRALAKATILHLHDKHFQEAWLQVTINYSRRKSTKQSDTLIALEGVMEGLQYIFKAEPFAGMWKQELWKQLTWWIDSPPATKVQDEEGDVFQAPSWSWLNARSAISYRNTIRTQSPDFEHLTSSVKVVELSTTSNSSRSKTSGTLRLQGDIFPYHLTKQDLMTPETKIWRRFKGNKGRWLLDYAMGTEIAEVGMDVQCLVLAEDDMLQMLVCLCLVETGAVDGTFRRVGLVHWDGPLGLVGRDNGGRTARRGVFTVI